MTGDERVEAVRELGYTEPEAEFLCLAALHSGYFLRRQYLQFVDKKYGYRDDALLTKALAKGHIRADRSARRLAVLRLASRPFFAVIGEADNRNRRSRPPLAIKQKLMALDYVLAHRDRRYLATEADKVSFFEARRVARAYLPCKRYRSDLTTAAIERYFVEKYPIAISGSDTSLPSPVVSFCYVDEGVLSTAGFASFLGRYSRLFVALGEFRLVYVAAGPRPFPQAEQKFRQFVVALKQAQWRLSGPQAAALAEYFELRQLLDSKQYERLDKAKLDRLRAYRKRFSQPGIEEQYRRLAGREQDQGAEKKTSLAAEFEAYRLNHSYDFFDSRV